VFRDVRVNQKIRSEWLLIGNQEITHVHHIITFHAGVPYILCSPSPQLMTRVVRVVEWPLVWTIKTLGLQNLI